MSHKEAIRLMQSRDIGVIQRDWMMPLRRGAIAGFANAWHLLRGLNGP
jgi:hypothetical protein